ncbi:MAG: adenylosuccinate synthetase [bacterium]
MTKVDILLGLQWGDEGKGKIIDVLTPRYDIIARFQGGPNAGHTLEFEGKKHVLHLIPSGIFHPGKTNILGNGMVICPIAFKKEVEGLLPYIPMEEIQKRIVIACGAQIILPTHRLLDAANEIAKGAGKIGSTLQGIGPTYTDKTSRIGICIGDILHENFMKKYIELKRKHIETGYLDKHLGIDRVNKTLENEENVFIEAIEFLKKFLIINGSFWIDRQLKAGKTILAEGAQGTLLDIDHGNFPFVTSSSTIAGGVCIGLGIAPNRIGKIYGLFKAYCTRVGSGPFPTELGKEQSDTWCAIKKVEDEKEKYPDADINDLDPFIQGIALRRKGYEFGATTGRLRRCGWLDLPALKYACMINGVTDLIISKADILSGFDFIDIGENHFPGDNFGNEQVILGKIPAKNATYATFKGWGDLQGITNFDNLPINFKKYLTYIEDKTEIPINIISTGPDRTQVIIK